MPAGAPVPRAFDGTIRKTYEALLGTKDDWYLRADSGLQNGDGARDGYKTGYSERRHLAILPRK